MGRRKRRTRDFCQVDDRGGPPVFFFSWYILYLVISDLVFSCRGNSNTIPVIIRRANKRCCLEPTKELNSSTSFSPILHLSSPHQQNWDNHTPFNEPVVSFCLPFFLFSFTHLRLRVSFCWVIFSRWEDHATLKRRRSLGPYFCVAQPWIINWMYFSIPFGWLG